MEKNKFGIPFERFAFLILPIVSYFNPGIREKPLRYIISCILVLISLLSFSVTFFEPSSFLLSRHESKKNIVNPQSISNKTNPIESLATLNPLSYESNIFELLNTIEDNSSSNIKYKNKILELETELDNIRNKLAKSSKVSKEFLKNRNAIQLLEKNKSEFTSDWSIPLLLELVEKINLDKQEKIVRINSLEKENKKLLRDLALIDDHNEQVFIQLEEAIEVSIGPLKRIFRSLGLPTENIIEQIRNSYSGSGGLFDPSSLNNHKDIDQFYNSKKSSEDLLEIIGELNLYRIAAETIPISVPVQSSNRFTSGFGPRKDPLKGTRAMHHGADFAAPKGTPIYATANGVVSYAGWYGGYGLLVIIKHGFGYETRYAHNSRIRVKAGQRVSRGDRISDMGSTGRSTGSHLHYEVRKNNKPINPMNYIKAGRHVF